MIYNKRFYCELLEDIFLLIDKMVPSGKLMLEEVLFQLELIMSKPIGTPAMTEIDRELIPILKQIKTIRFVETQHPAVCYLLNWMSHPQRTAEEFNYVLGPLSKYVDRIEGDEYNPYLASSYNSYMYFIAAESLAAKCPILEGPWEYAAWLLVQTFKCYVDIHTHFPYQAHDSLAEWIICVIGDADICPNPHLRREFMCFLISPNIDTHNGTNALESVMHAMFAVDFNYLKKDPNEAELEMISFSDIISIFQVIGNDAIPEYSHRLSNKLEYVKQIRLSSVIHDVTYQCSVNPSNYNEPYELNTIINLLKIINGYVSLKLKESEEGGININWESRLDNITSIGIMFFMIIHKFKECLLLPQLISTTSSLIMEVMEFFCLSSRGIYNDGPDAGEPYLYGINQINNQLGELSDEHGYDSIILSPLAPEIWGKYSNRLKSLRTRIMNIFAFSNVQALIYLDYYFERSLVKLPQMHEIR